MNEQKPAPYPGTQAAIAAGCKCHNYNHEASMALDCWIVYGACPIHGRPAWQSAWVGVDKIVKVCKEFGEKLLGDLAKLTGGVTYPCGCRIMPDGKIIPSDLCTKQNSKGST